MEKKVNTTSNKNTTQKKGSVPQDGDKTKKKDQLMEWKLEDKEKSL